MRSDAPGDPDTIIGSPPLIRQWRAGGAWFWGHMVVRAVLLVYGRRLNTAHATRFTLAECGLRHRIPDG
ncbi:hypothetical protein ACFSOZ_31990 [Mesorhizobium newzealandense]|uniref:Transposase n=1 Tax=Mesorhizobium newzealandense TaxID=1300302 RepID=A0ABW4UJA6_9HYPH